MKAKQPVVIFNPYTVIPSYGENRISLLHNNSQLEISIFYDAPSGDDEAKVCFLFENCCFHKFSSFPGVSDSIIQFENHDDISSLIEFTVSDYKMLWETQFKNLFKFKHFVIFFTSANQYLEVISENVSVLT